jgi:WD40 repeat protein
LFNKMGRNPLDKPQPKNKSSPVFIVGVFVAIVILMLIAKMRSQTTQKISIPLNNGVVSLLTYSNLLAAISNDNKIYVLQWSDLSKKPREGVVESSEAVFVAPDTILSVKRTNPDCLVVSGFDANSITQKIPLSLTSNAASLCASQDGSKIILLLERGAGERVTYELFEFEFNTKQARPIATIPSEQSKLEHLSVSNDGRYVVAVGEKNEHGWLFVVDTKENRILWQQELLDLKKLYKGVFSNDGEIIYIRGSDSMLTLVKANSGKIIDRLLLTEENKSTYRAQPTQTVTVSSDGELVAATVFGSVYVCDTKTRKKYDIVSAGHKVFSSMVFSPDAKFIATSDMRQGGDIKIVRTPRH